MKNNISFKKSVFALCILFACVSFIGCANNYPPKVSDEIWDNSNAVYVDIATDFVESVFNDWESAFSDIGLKATYITNKEFKGAYNSEYDPSLTLLLVLENGGAENQATAVELLNNDNRVKAARVLNDVPYEPINTLSFQQSQISAKIGNTVTLEVSGYSSEYAPWFSHESIFPIVLKNYDKNKTYSPADFPLSGASKIDVMNLDYADYLELHLEAPSYFNAIKAVHAVAQNPDVLAVSLNYVGYPGVVFSDSWFVSDTSLAEITNLEPNGWDADGKHTGHYDGAWTFEERIAAEVLCKEGGTFTVTFTQSLGWRMGGSATITIVVE